MGSKRGRSDHDEYNFVAYDPAKKTCTPADRSLIKRHAGKLGSETKKRRLRRNGVARSSPFSRNERAGSGASSTSDNENKPLPLPVLAQEWPSMLATRCQTATPPTPFPEPLDAGIWTQMEASDWQNPPVRDLTPISANDSQQTTASSVTQPNRLTPADSVSFNGDIADPFSLRSEFTEPNFVGYGHQDIPQHPHHYFPRPFGSFDSGFYDNESLNLSLADVDAHSGLAADVPAPEQHPQSTSSKPNGSPSSINWPPGDTGAYTVQHNSSMHIPAGMETLGENANSRNGNDFNRVNRQTPPNVATPPTNPSTRSPLSNHHAMQEQLSPRTSCPRARPDVDSALVNSIRYREEHGQLSAGSSDECLRALSESDEARSLWILNLSRVSPELVQCAEQPTDVYAKARTKLRSMTHRQQMDVLGILIKLGMAEYHAISFALEVKSLQQDVANRKCLGILSKAEALVDHSLTDLAPGAQSVLNHLWPEEGGVRNLRKVA